MTNMGWTEISGEGEMLFAGGDYKKVCNVLAFVGDITSPRVRITGTVDPRRVQYGGTIGLSGEDVDHDDVMFHDVNYHHTWPLNWTQQYIVPLADHFDSVGGGDNRIFWRIPPGITWWIDVYYDFC